MKVVKRPDAFFEVRFTFDDLKAAFVKDAAAYVDLAVDLPSIDFKKVFNDSTFFKNWTLQRAGCELGHPQPMPHLPPFSQIISQRMINQNRVCAVIANINQSDSGEVTLIICSAGPLGRELNDLYGLVNFETSFRFDIVDATHLEIYGVDLIYKKVE